MRVHLGSDHAGFDVKNVVAEALRGDGHEVVDHGAFTFDEDDDYPVYCLRAAEAVAHDDASLGVVLGGSGNGEQIAANKVHGIRAALAWSADTARLSRQHNDARVVAVGARAHPVDEVVGFVRVFLTTAFSGDERHARRIVMLSHYEQTGELPLLSGDASA
ncbi:MAG TPA: ribose-5-phosphate isomerase [Jiangellaceae bacterium]|nr:ribose-5-phosphate isomerase [Jiangellaceae bacterium]